MKRTLKSRNLLFVALVVAFGTCSSSPVFANDGQQMALANNEQALAR